LSVCKHRLLRPALRAEEAIGPDKQGIARADLSKPESIGPLFACFQNNLYEPQNSAESPDQPPNQRPDQVADSA
jgi:hypothetical protein